MKGVSGQGTVRKEETGKEGGSEEARGILAEGGEGEGECEGGRGVGAFEKWRENKRKYARNFCLREMEVEGMCVRVHVCVRVCVES